MKIGNKEFDTAKHTYIMGILNVTPDSFSDGGKWNGYEAAQAFLMKEQAVPEGVMLTGRVVEEMDRKTGEAYAGENIET